MSDQPTREQLREALAWVDQIIAALQGEWKPYDTLPMIGALLRLQDAAEALLEGPTDEMATRAARSQYEYQVGRMVAIAEANEKMMILPEWDELAEDDQAHRIEAAMTALQAALRIEELGGFNR
jgi:hypothetical protein